MEGDSGDSDNSSAGMHPAVAPRARQPGPEAEGTPRRSSPSWPLLSTSDQDHEDPEEKFEIEMQLGRGSYGTVHKARVKATGETIAVKIIPLGEQDEIQDIQREIEMLQECDHANVVRYLGSWRGRDALWIGMEYCGGGSVSDLMHASDAPLEEDLIAFIAAEALAGLAYLHSIGKVHRDIKCGNILLTEAGEVKLADFGVAAQLTATMSKRNTFIGTPHWMAPEVIQESRYDGKVDVWALGISCIEMAEVVPPRWAVHPMRVIFMISREPPPSLTDKNKWPLTMQDFIAQCLQKDTRVRPTAKQLQGHKWVAQARPAVAATLLPLIRRSREELARASAAVMGDAVARTPAAPTPIQRSSAAASGHFSWRPGPSTGTVAAGGGGVGGTVVAAHTPTRPPLDGLSYVSTPMASVMESEVGSSDSGTLVMRGSGTLRGGGSTFRPAAAWGPPGPAQPSTPAAAAAASTFVVTPDGTEGGDYLAALRSAAKDNDGYLAAASSAAQEGRVSPRGAATPVFPPQPSAGPGAGQQAAGEAARLVQRLRALYEGGAVVPIPTLRAAQAPALALLNDIRAPYLPPNASHLPLGQRAQVAVAPWECAALLEALAQEGDGTSAGPGPGAGPGSDGGSRVPPAVLARVAGSPGLLNLVRVLAYHRRVACTEVLPPPAAEQLQATILSYSDTVRSILCL